MCSETNRHMLLVIDDDPGIRESLAYLLEDEGYTVMTAINGRDALQRLRASSTAPCVILLDLMMPVMSGPEFYEELRNDPSLSEIPVVIISADGNGQRKAKAMASEFIPKPVKIETVLTAVGHHCA